MGPPKKGTHKYKEYLKKQKKRRQEERLQTRARGFGVDVDEVVVQKTAEALEQAAVEHQAAVRVLQQARDEAALRSNRHFRENNTLKRQIAIRDKTIEATNKRWENKLRLQEKAAERKSLDLQKHVDRLQFLLTMEKYGTDKRAAGLFANHMSTGYPVG